MGKSTISMAIFNSFLYVYQRVLGFNVEKEKMGKAFIVSFQFILW